MAVAPAAASPRADASPPATPHVTHEQLRLPQKLLVRRRYQLPPDPTMRHVMLGIAGLGGHIRSNGDPGWLMLGRGLTRLLDAEVGWRLAREEM